MSKFQYTPENEAKFQEYVSRYPKIDSCMLPALWLVQEQEGWVSPEAMVYVAEKLGKTPIQVYEVATFYTMFNLKPIGKYHIELCKTVSCMLCGSRELKQHIKETIGIDAGQTSEDGLFTLSEVECLGACGGAPMFALNGEYHEKLTKEKVDELIKECKNDN
ncbi:MULTISPECIES: NADH-quinone oxidoreductase subunit NuoE [Arcobacter]|jgi:NADH-quinone oxidoreductase subunit E|uniref:NADH-quinone oxidoreductase subunit NuoE n=1 Tax=Arcobacter ellisii TaxID=913109 RepID=A0A347U5M6_9BACT|nr:MULTISPECIES: NADH-quinone oxidoreductase subunit NuoE [Arcobacter]AXX94154.1 NADH:quinone oxidoreductase I, chain E (thioredoxin-like [2Fe-2S] ferredoxin family) [Arcobacter ellisii]MBD3829058.1 NADH-quinone oxidoreductase subunit NuoE [Arcobacter sp.]MDY3204939.1 NADH-quinone oxidoreductase subunit NuoE [Arcobacter sp.]RXI32512.1 NADH-quinone oxidoreductase subunit NuoE [Arcobacter ellisii]